MTEPAKLDDRRADVPIDVLDLASQMIENLKRARILTVRQLADELKDEKALMDKVIGCGKKKVLELRAAIDKYQSASPDVPSLPPPGIAPPAATTHNPSRSGSSAAQPKTRADQLDNRVLLYVFLVLVLSAVVGNIAGAQIPPVALYLLYASFSLVAARFFYQFSETKQAVLVGSAEKAIDGGKIKGRIRLLGASAVGGAAFLLLSGMTVLAAPQVVHVYLTATSAPGTTSPAPRGEFRIMYPRGVAGRGSAVGHDGTAAIHDLPFWHRRVKVDRFECFGYTMAEEAGAGDGGSPVFEISNSSITIPVTKIKPAQDPMPTRKTVLEDISREGVSKNRIKTPGTYSKEQVALTIENQSDRPIVFVAYDCVDAYSSEPPVDHDGNAWMPNKNSGNIQQGRREVWGNFDTFQAPTGWFALYVRYDDTGQNKVVQQCLGIRNLFQTRAALLVIERSEEAGIRFRLGNGSKLEE